MYKCLIMGKKSSRILALWYLKHAVTVRLCPCPMRGTVCESFFGMNHGASTTRLQQHSQTYPDSVRTAYANARYKTYEPGCTSLIVIIIISLIILPTFELGMEQAAASRSWRRPLSTIRLLCRPATASSYTGQVPTAGTSLSRRCH